MLFTAFLADVNDSFLEPLSAIALFVAADQWAARVTVACGLARLSARTQHARLEQVADVFLTVIVGKDRHLNLLKNSAGSTSVCARKHPLKVRYEMLL